MPTPSEILHLGRQGQAVQSPETPASAPALIPMEQQPCSEEKRGCPPSAGFKKPEVCMQSFSGSSCLKSKSSEPASAITCCFCPLPSKWEPRTLQDAPPSCKA